METEPKLSYYQKNKQKILENRRLKRLENTKQGRPFAEDEDIVLVVQSVVELVVEPVVEPVVDIEPLDIPVKKSKKSKTK